MHSSVGLVDIGGGGGGKQERSGGCGGGGGRGKSGAELIGVGDSGVGALEMERVAENWWDNVRESSSSWIVRSVESGSRVSSSSVSKWEGSEGSRWVKVLAVLVGTNEGYEWVAVQWWETITVIAPLKRT